MLPFVGFITGPLRLLGGLVQAVSNFVIAFFTLIPSLCGAIDPQSRWHIYELGRDCGLGAMHGARGFLETLPFLSIVFLKIGASEGGPVGASENSTYGASLRRVISTDLFHRAYRDHPFELDMVERVKDAQRAALYLHSFSSASG